MNTVLLKKLGTFVTASFLAAGFLFSSLPAQAQTAQAMINLTARDLDQGGPSYWSNSVNADIGDRIEFSITVRSTGLSPLYNPRITVSLPWGMQYVLGSTRLNGIQADEGIVNYDGLKLENMAAGESRTVTFQATIPDGSYFYNGSGTLTPYAYVKADNLINTYQDSIKLIVGGTVLNASTNTNTNNSNTVSNDTLNDIYPILAVEGRGANFSRGDLSYTYSTYAIPGEIVEFAVKVKSSSVGTLSGVWVSDRLPPEMSYVSKSTTIDGVSAPDGIATSDGVQIGTLAANQTKTVKFRARILPRKMADGEVISLVNYTSARASGTQISVENDSLIVVTKGKNTQALPVSSATPSSSPAPSSNNNSTTTAEVLGASTVKTGPSGTAVVVTAAALLLSLFVYGRLRGDKILRSFEFWESWKLKKTLRKLKGEKSE